MIGQTINSYRIMEQVAAGGFGTLYRAERLFLNRVSVFNLMKLTTRQERSPPPAPPPILGEGSEEHETRNYFA